MRTARFVNNFQKGHTIVLFSKGTTLFSKDDVITKAFGQSQFNKIGPKLMLGARSWGRGLGSSK